MTKATARASESRPNLWPRTLDLSLLKCYHWDDRRGGCCRTADGGCLMARMVPGEWCSTLTHTHTVTQSVDGSWWMLFSRLGQRWAVSKWVTCVRVANGQAAFGGGGKRLSNGSCKSRKCSWFMFMAKTRLLLSSAWSRAATPCISIIATLPLSPSLFLP